MRGALAVLAVAGLSACGQMSPEIETAKALVGAELRDPRSAQWEGVRVETLPPGVEPPRLTPNGTVVCGSVNGRNAYGAYAGFQRFIVDLGSEEVWLEPIVTEAGIDGAADRFEAITFNLVFATACPRA